MHIYGRESCLKILRTALVPFENNDDDVPVPVPSSILHTDKPHNNIRNQEQEQEQHQKKHGWNKNLPQNNRNEDEDEPKDTDRDMDRLQEREQKRQEEQDHMWLRQEMAGMNLVLRALADVRTATLDVCDAVSAINGTHYITLFSTLLPSLPFLFV